MIIGNPITLGGGGKPKKLLSSLTEGSLVSVLEDGKLTPFYVAKHNYEADLNGEGRTLLVRKTLHSLNAWNSNSGQVYQNSTIDTWLNGDYFNTLSAAVKASSPVTNFEVKEETVTRSVFLLSLAELGLSIDYGTVEGEVLPIASTLRVATFNGVATEYWVRSVFTANGSMAARVTDTGVGSYKDKTQTAGVRPCFTLPATMALRETPYADGSWGLIDEYEPTDTVDITENGIHNVKAFSFANVNVQSAPVLLWTNASPTSNFAAQTVAVNGAGYDAYLIETNAMPNTKNNKKIAYVPKNTTTTIAQYNGSGSAFWRNVTAATDTGITFSLGGYSTSSSKADSVIPTRIWGVKFTL